MRLSQRWKWILRCLGAVPLADKFLIIIMAILLFQSGFLLFAPSLQTSNMIDVVIRTTSASIFGYFISSNFLAGGRAACDIDPPELSATMVVTPTPPAIGSIKAEIGFRPNTEPENPQSGYAQALPDNPPERENRFQVLVVAMVGIVALLLLIIARNHLAANFLTAPTLSQLRDFVSGSVGFLLGHTTHRPKSTAF